MSDEKLTHDQAKKLAEFIYSSLNDYINDHYNAFLEFLEKEQKKIEEKAAPKNE